MRNLQISLLSTAALSLLFAAPALAQGGQTQSVGLGQLKRSWNMTELSGTLPGTAEDGRIRGVAAHPNGLLYVSGRNGGSDDEHRVYIIDPDTTTLMGFFKVHDHAGDWGALDMDVDLAGNIVAGGRNGVTVFDVAGNTVSTITGAAGPIALALGVEEGTAPDFLRRTIGQPIIGNQSGALDAMEDSNGERTFEAMAFDPNGDGGNGSVFVAQGLDAGEFLELRISDGTVVRTFAPGPDSNGMAIDPISGQLWVNKSFDTAGNAIVEMDLNGSVDADMDGLWDLLETGLSVPKLVDDNDVDERTYGGIDFMAGGDPVQSPFFGASAWDMVQISQDDEGSSGTDFLAIHRVHQFIGVHGLGESQLRGSVGGDPISITTPVLFEPGSTLNWGVASNGRPNPGGPAAIILNFGADAKIDGTTILGGGIFPELVAINALSAPAAVVGEVIQSTSVDAITSVTLPPAFNVDTGDLIRLQALYFEPASPTLLLGASNELWFVGNVIKDVMIEMDAPSPFHVDLVNPAFRVTELSGDPAKAITKVVWDVGDTNSELPGDNWFDVDESLMFDFFGAGDGTVYGCTGTYRNGSDVSSGLIYAGTDVINWPGSRFPCADDFRALDGMGNPIDPISGFVGSDQNGRSGRAPRIVTFTFTPGMFVGMTFGFDADLDGTLNTASLRDWGGTWVHIERADGSSFSGVLYPDSDPAHPDRAITGF